MREGEGDIEDFLGRRIFEDFIKLHEENKGFRDFLSFLKENDIRYGIQSNIDKKTYKRLRERFGWDPKIEILSCDLKVSKPDPIFFESIIEEVEEKFIIVDEKPRNVKIAKSVGCEAVLFKNFESLRREIWKYLK